MLDNIISADQARSLFRSKSRQYTTKTVRPNAVEAAVQEGWEIGRKNKKSVRLHRSKAHGTQLEDRVWVLFYRMGFQWLSGDRGAKLTLNPKDDNSPKTQIDVIGVDNEVALAVECKSAETPSKRPQFAQELAKLSQVREKFSLAVRMDIAATTKRQVALLFFSNNLLLSDNDYARAKDANVAVFDSHDLAYYEALVAHIGPAARYQFLADVLPGKIISGLEIKVPAVKNKMGAFPCFTFSISPEYLLKIAYVSHRAKGRASDVDTYQRMLKKSRLVRIREYIDNDGIFPTNIVLNIERNRLQFDRIHQESTTGADAGVLGWLTIRPAYKSAWIIDGQHRLFAYSGSEKAAHGRLAVMAFEGLPGSKQAELFIDINAKQKSVPRSLLEELYAKLHWDAEQTVDRVSAIVSRAILELDNDPDSPFFGRIQKSDESKDPVRCVSLTSVFGAIDKAKFHIAKEKQKEIISYGPMWGVTNEGTLNRTISVLKYWFSEIRTAAADWWDRGSGDGGGLAMNDSITSCINVLRSVFQYLESGKHKLVEIDTDDLIDLCRPYGQALGRYLAAFTEEERRRFRDLRGVQGQTKRTRMCQAALRQEFPSFSPPELDAYIQAEKAQTNLRSKAVIDEIEKMLQSIILEELHREFPDGDNWWIMGVPKEIRKKVTTKYEDEDRKRGGKEHYFELIDYKHIASHRWELFEHILGYGKGGKDKRLAWLDFVNERRKVVSHISSGVTLSIDDLAQLQEYSRWLSDQLAGKQNGQTSAASV